MTSLLETQIAKPVVEHFQNLGFAVREEVPVLLEGRWVSADMIVEIPNESGDTNVVAELKAQLDDDLVEQALRWIGYAEEIYVGYPEPRRVSKPHDYRLDKLVRSGIGIFWIHAGVATRKHEAAFNSDLIDGRIAIAFHAAVVGYDPAAGSKNASRNIESRAKWIPVTEWLAKNGPATWVEIKRSVVSVGTTTAKAARKAIRKREWVGVTVSNDAIAVFGLEKK